MNPNTSKPSAASHSIRLYTIAGAGTIALMVIGVGGWAATANLSGAVVGAGIVVVDGNVKRIQHREGGIVGDIRVRNGTVVKAGDLLIRLDDTVTRAGLAMVEKQIEQLNARRLRLSAERENAREMTALLTSPANTTALDGAEYIQAEVALFRARRQTLDGQKAQLKQRIDQIRQENEGLVVRKNAKEEELSWIGQELVRVRSLAGQQLIQFNRLAELERLRAQLDGERGQFMAEIARAATRITETELQILQLDQDRLAEVLTELRDVENKLAELSEQKVTAEDQLRRIDIRSPHDGVVHELAVHTIGGVITPGETVMQIVPVNDRLVVETKIQPADIDQIHVGQQAILRFSAFNQRTTPEIAGYVKTVAADLVSNPQTGESWYTSRIHIDSEELKKLSNLSLLAGMPVEAYIKTTERTALSYLVKPLADQINRAMREE
ncbi:putative secretion protein (HlyD family); putative Proteases secretion protein [Agrobacterium fabrum str. J-07]|uniref:HlyD family type I secretion periplasmic adaptor subunit n=1 Tax=Agrobacterium fabrum TaxID=1176649 RepID=UPI0009B99F30|nr:HlyD family type I secretion periplasmic adaptor subunit [Agrobacterium fabrum]CUX57625.1 putative secretion protein (HlyD family); putative Proteases secretion protein [Agrobacterium fabrum str. J-07]